MEQHQIRRLKMASLTSKTHQIDNRPAAELSEFARHQLTKVVFRSELLVALLFGIIALLYTLPIFKDINNWGIQDWDQHLFFHGVPRQTLVEFRQIPLWNPYYVGGTVMLANPQSRFLSPSFLLHMLFGEVIGIKLEIWLYLVIGLAGTYTLARQYKLDRSAAFLAACVFMLSSMYALALTVGMTWFLTVAYLPWAFFFYQKTAANLRYGLVCGLVLALMFFGGGAYPLAVTLLFLTIYTMILLIFKEYRLLRLVTVMGVIAIFMLCFGAIKFLPAIEFQRTHPRTVYDYSGYSLNSLRFSLFSRNQSLDAIAGLPIEEVGFLNGVTGGMDENGLYIGLIPFALFIAGIELNDKKRFFLFVCFLIFLWISFGNRPRAELWSLLHLLPVYDSMRLAQRFRIVFMLCLAVFAGFGWQTLKYYLQQKLPNPILGQLLALALLLFVVGDLLMVSSRIFKDAFPIPPQNISRSQAFYQVWDFSSYNEHGPIDLKFYETQRDHLSAYTDPQLLYASFGSLYPTFQANIGSINGYESANVPRNATPIATQEYQGEAYLKDTTGSVVISEWSPNKLVVQIEASGAGYLVVNQNYYWGWQAEGRQVENVEQLLGVKVFPGDRQITLYYRPASFVMGAVVTGITLLGSGIYGGILLWAVFRRWVTVELPAPTPSPAG